MAEDYSSEGLLSYLREETVAGRMHPATARSRRKAADALFNYLNDSERADLRTLDLDALAVRIHNAPRGELRGELVALYSQRLAVAIDDYCSATVTDAPGNPTAGDAPAVAPSSKPAPAPAPALQPDEERALESVRLSFDRYKADVVPIPLGTGRVVYLHGMPVDLTDEEAAKIVRVVQAFASGKDTKQ